MVSKDRFVISDCAKHGNVSLEMLEECVSNVNIEQKRERN